MIGAVENCDFVGQVDIFDTIYEKHYNFVTVKYRVDIPWNNSQTSGAIHP